MSLFNLMMVFVFQAMCASWQPHPSCGISTAAAIKLRAEARAALAKAKGKLA